VCNIYIYIYIYIYIHTHICVCEKMLSCKMCQTQIKEREIVYFTCFLNGNNNAL